MYGIINKIMLNPQSLRGKQFKEEKIMSRRTRKQKMMKEVFAQMAEMRETAEKEETPEKISKEIFQEITEKYGLEDDYEADVWSGNIFYIMAEGLVQTQQIGGVASYLLLLIYMNYKRNEILLKIYCKRNTKCYLKSEKIFEEHDIGE